MITGQLYTQVHLVQSGMIKLMSIRILLHIISVHEPEDWGAGNGIGLTDTAPPAQVCGPCTQVEVDCFVHVVWPGEEEVPYPYPSKV